MNMSLYLFREQTPNSRQPKKYIWLYLPYLIKYQSDIGYGKGYQPSKNCVFVHTDLSPALPRRHELKVISDRGKVKTFPSDNFPHL